MAGGWRGRSAAERRYMQQTALPIATVARMAVAVVYLPSTSVCRAAPLP